MNSTIWPGGLDDFLEDCLETLFELAAILRAGNERTHVERHDLLVLEPFRNVTSHDSRGQAFDDGGLADARFADQTPDCSWSGETAPG